ncbi:MAG: hypothetical protein ABIJ85_02940 [bacterium]
MADFIVSEIIDGDTFKVKNGWKWNKKKGDTVRPTGYDTPERGEPGYEQAKQKLKNLILGKTVDIRSAKVMDEWGDWLLTIITPAKILPIIFRSIKTDVWAWFYMAWVEKMAYTRNMKAVVYKYEKSRFGGLRLTHGFKNFHCRFSRAQHRVLS